jgi:hypothetical protein
MEQCNSQLKDLNIVDNNTIIRLGWAGHITRMEDERVPRMILKETFLNTRPVRKQRIIRENVVRTDTSQILGIQGWRRRK